MFPREVEGKEKDSYGRWHSKGRATGQDRPRPLGEASSGRRGEVWEVRVSKYREGTEQVSAKHLPSGLHE